MRLSLFLTGAFLAIWVAVLSGLGLIFTSGSTTQVFVSTHLIISLVGMLLLGVFLYHHWWSRQLEIHKHANSLLGYLTLDSLILLALSGVGLLIWTNFPPLRWLHDAAMVVLLIDLSVHMAYRFLPLARTRLKQLQGTPLATWGVMGACLSALCIALVGTGFVLSWGKPASAASLPFAHAVLGDKELSSAKTCAACHPDQAQQWQSSAHAHSPEDAYYQAVAGIFMQENGVEASRLCAGCHNPVGLLSGEITTQAPLTLATPVATPAVAVSIQKAYKVRGLRVALSISPNAAEGVTCVICHQTVKAAAQPENASLQLSADNLLLPGTILGELALRSAPADHRAALMRSTILQAELCGACHNLSLPSGLPLERTFDEWRDSSYPDQGKTCQFCHMPTVVATLDNSGLPQIVHAHGGQPGSPNSLPGFSTNLDLLQKAATLQAGLARDGQALVATVQVTNSGAGHYLPTGSDDLRQAWLEAILWDGAGNEVWHSGRLDAYGALTPDTVQFHRVIGDAAGQPIELHRIWAATQILEDTRLAPEETRSVIYHIPQPDVAAGPYTFQVRLCYRPVSQSFAEFALGRPVPDLPVFEMASVKVSTP